MIIKNVNILTCDENSIELTYVNIYIRENKIKKIFSGDVTSSDYPNEEIIDGKSMTALPGFINTHTHSAMTFLRNYGNDMNLQDWLFNKIFPAEDKLTEEACYWFNKLAYIEFIKSGITTHCDNYFFMNSAAKAVEETGIRAVLSRSVSGISDPSLSKLKESSDFYKSYNNTANGRINVTLGAHSIYTSDEAYLRKVIEEAHAIGSGLQIHLSETKKEVEDCYAEHKCSPVEYLNNIGYFGVDGIKIAAHCVHMSESDIDILKNSNVSISANLSSNLKLASGIINIPHLTERGLNVTLGTDGASSNNNLNMFNEMRLASLLYKGMTLDPTIMNADTVLSLATRNAAKAIGRADLGCIAEGMIADIILVDTNSPSIAPVNERSAAIVYSAAASDVDTVICNGVMLMHNHRLLTIDEPYVIAKATEYAQKILG